MTFVQHRPYQMICRFFSLMVWLVFYMIISLRAVRNAIKLQQAYRGNCYIAWQYFYF